MVSPRYLLDTNVFSASWAPRPDIAVRRRMHTHEGALATAAPVVHEMVYGARRLAISRRRERIERYIADVVAQLPILAYDSVVAQWHAVERARLERIGRTPPYLDGQIAAIAAVNGLVLVTANLRDYQQFQGLQVEDWRS